MVCEKCKKNYIVLKTQLIILSVYREISNMIKERVLKIHGELLVLILNFHPFNTMLK